MTFEDAIIAVLSELKRARAKYCDWGGAHEGYAVILEQCDNLSIELDFATGKPRIDVVRQELTRICAMALRFLADIFDLDGKDSLAKVLAAGKQVKTIRGRCTRDVLRRQHLLNQQQQRLWESVKDDDEREQEQAAAALGATALAFLMSTEV